MASVNKWIGIGNLTKDPEVRFATNGDAIANCSIACNETWKDKAGNKQERVEYIRISFFGKLAEIVGEYLRKGSSIYVEGRIETKKWKNKEGVDQYTTGIIAEKMQMLGGKTVQYDAPVTTKQKTNEQSNPFDDFGDAPF